MEDELAKSVDKLSLGEPSPGTRPPDEEDDDPGWGFRMRPDQPTPSPHYTSRLDLKHGYLRHIQHIQRGNLKVIKKQEEELEQIREQARIQQEQAAAVAAQQDSKSRPYNVRERMAARQARLEQGSISRIPSADAGPPVTTTPVAHTTTARESGSAHVASEAPHVRAARPARAVYIPPGRRKELQQQEQQRHEQQDAGGQ